MFGVRGGPKSIPLSERSAPARTEVDPEHVRVTRDGDPVHLSGLPLRILKILAASPGRLVTRAELKLALWPHASRIDTDRRLNTAMRALRKALAETAHAPRFIETVRGHGYRWVAAPTDAPRRHTPVLMVVAALLTALPLVSDVRLAPGEPATEDAAAVVRSLALVEAGRGLSGTPAGGPATRARSGRSVALLEARSAFEAWRSDPREPRAAAARTALAAAYRKLGADADLDVLAAELALKSEWNWSGAERMYRRAIAADPNNLAARRGLAWLYVGADRRRQAWAEAAQLVGVERLGTEASADTGWLMLRLDRPDLALAFCSGGSEHMNILECRHTALARLERYAEARSAALVLMRRAGGDAASVAAAGEGSAAEGYRRFLLWRAQAFGPSRGHWFQRAQLQAEAGLLDEALASLETAVRLKDPSVVKIGSAFSFEKIVDTPKFRALRARVLSGR